MSDIVLEKINGNLCLVDKSAGAPGPLFVEFSGGAVGFRRKQGMRSGDPLYKAIGANNTKKLLIFDCTAGLGRDAFMMAVWGNHVVAYEQSEILFQLLEDGYRRASECAHEQNDDDLRNILSRLEFKNSNSIDVLKGLAKEKLPDVIYIDPMFPERKKTALVKKEMQYLHKLIGDDISGTELVRLAMNCCKDRVVVKRAIDAEPLLKPVTSSFASKTMRLDMYKIDSNR